METDIYIPPAFRDLFNPARYKVYYGGRGGAKSWSFARALLIRAITDPLRVLCAREFQVSISDSVYRLLIDQIAQMGLEWYFSVTKTDIRGANGSQFIFKGLHHNTAEIKSLEGVDVCWVEEAQSVSAESWDVLIPTIRKAGSEIWISFNPTTPDAATWRRFVETPPDGAIVRKVNYTDNPWTPATLMAEAEYCKRVDPEAYAHIWQGYPKTTSDAQIFKGKFIVEPFETPAGARFFHGVDWGFSNDPTALVRCFIDCNRLYIDAEAYGVGVELDETAQLFDSIPTARKWPIKADNARPETISFMRRRGFNITAAKKWAGSVEDGIEILKSFEKIIIHPRCRHTADEFRLYSYKTDRNNGDILPIVEDANNHCIAEGERVMTARGEIPIESVQAGDFVLTRGGFKRVIKAFETGRNKSVVQVLTCGGRSVVCTPDHKILTPAGWKQAQELQKGEHLLCLKSTLSYMMGTDGTAIQTLHDCQTSDILNTLLQTGRNTFTAISGANSTAKSLQECRYITKTGTRLTTRRGILNALRQASMLQGITRQSAKNRRGSIWRIFARKQPSGTKATQGGSIRVGYFMTCGNAFYQSAGSAHIVGKSFIRTLWAKKKNFVLTPARAHIGENLVLTMSRASASIAGGSFQPTNTAGSVFVLDAVSCVRAMPQNAPRVFDMTVEDLPEFFAGGICVLDCVDALRYSLDGYIKGSGPLNISPLALSRR